MATRTRSTETDTDNATEPDPAMAALGIVTAEKVPLKTRGRSFDPDVLAIRSVLLAAQEDGLARAFEGLDNTTDDGKKAVDKRKRQVTSAAKSIGEDFEAMAVYDNVEHKLYFGPKEVIEKLQKAS